MNQNQFLNQWRDAVASDLELLSLLHDVEPDQNLLTELKEQKFPQYLGLKLEADEVSSMQQALAELDLSDQQLDELAVDFADIYLNHSLQASPHESVWIDEENLMHQQPMFQIRNWYQQYGLQAENWRIRSEDHLVLQLKFISHLFKRDQQLDTLQKTTHFMDEHLLRWLPLFCQRVVEHCQTPYYAQLHRLTHHYFKTLRSLLEQLLDQPRPSEEEIKQRLCRS